MRSPMQLLRDLFTRPARPPRGELTSTNLRGSYDAARTTPDFANYWANADYLDADGANSREVRRTLVARSRYELGNNGYADGISKTIANDLVAAGPALRMQTGSKAFNRLIEQTWREWAEAIQLRNTLWIMARSKYSDGETFALIRRNPAVRSLLKLDLQLRETEQCTSPAMLDTGVNYVDGIQFDGFGNPTSYDFLLAHPGGQASGAMSYERIAADRVLHWFAKLRPGEHRAVPEATSTLNTGAAGRRFREATLAAAETAADFTLFLKTQMSPDDFAGTVPMSTHDIEKRMMTALPDGYDPFQMKAEHPTSTYEAFHKLIVNEQARPASMPYNKAACDSSSYNYASGRLDHETYYGELDTKRADCNDQVLNPLFGVWFDLAVSTYGWLGGRPNTVGPAARAHAWDWPKFRVADVVAEANASQTNIQSGQLSLSRAYANRGLDLEDEITQMARDYAVSEQEIRERLLNIALPPPPNIGAAASSDLANDDQAAGEDADETETDAVAASISNRVFNTNGASRV